MTENMISEIIKAAAYGHTAESIASVMNINVSEAETILKENKNRIEETKKYYAEMEK